MEQSLSASTVLLNVGIQILNLVIFFLLFKFLLGDTVAKGLEEREHLLDRIKNAEGEYNTIIQDAEAQKNGILADALEKQKSILKEWELLNKKLSQDVLDDAKRKAEDIIQHATTETKRVQEELANNWESAVKSTTKSVVKKLLNEKKDLQDDYLKTLIDDLEDK